MKVNRTAASHAATAGDGGGDAAADGVTAIAMATACMPVTTAGQSSRNEFADAEEPDRGAGASARLLRTLSADLDARRAATQRRCG